ncbi:MAG: ORF6N domain-containing protein [Alphaproteobacteria bacterium]
MLDADLAKLYGVSVKRVNEQVRRNRSRFPSDFMIHLTREEYEALRSQFATLNPRRGEHRKSSLCVYQAGRSNASGCLE